MQLEEVNVTINKLLEQSQYVIIVNARMDLKAFSMSDENTTTSNQQPDTVQYQDCFLTVPQNIKQNTGEPTSILLINICYMD